MIAFRTQLTDEDMRRDTDAVSRVKRRLLECVRWHAAKIGDYVPINAEDIVVLYDNNSDTSHYGLAYEKDTNGDYQPVPDYLRIKLT